MPTTETAVWIGIGAALVGLGIVAVLLDHDRGLSIAGVTAGLVAVVMYVDGWTTQALVMVAVAAIAAVEARRRRRQAA